MTAHHDHIAAPTEDGPVADGRPACAPLAVTRLTLTNFRSYAAGEIAARGGPVVLVGPNGAGKTNVLDALSLLCPGRGLRGAKLGEHIRKGPSVQSEALWAVAATVSRNGESHEIGTGLTVGPNGGERRQLRLNGAPAASTADLSEILQMNWLTPAMDRLFIESASGRRRFLDRLVFGFDAGHARRAVRYETAMRERARLLKFGPRDPAWLDGLEAEMADAGTQMIIARAQTVARLNRALEHRGQAGAFPCAQLGVMGDADQLVENCADPAQVLRERYLRARVRDAEAGRTTFGPHLSDMAVRHTTKRADARTCSTGEQKALLISIILAQSWESAHMNGVPVLLLDEIAAHLDSTRRAALAEEILALGAQAWMTGTDLSLFDAFGSRAETFVVGAGQFVRQD
ncbi:MAG TPA: DNA replication/repair protein RecF [Rhizomicrobium sp.]|nr:DNA replication/repair protein RecF [Rhizomicrobium sp.]